MNKYQDILTKLLTVFNGHWPPKAQFDNWPIEFAPYMEIADEIPEKLSISSTSEKFRTWMKNALNKVNASSAVEIVNNKKSNDHVDPVLLGFLSCLSFLIQSYRWGTLPVTQEEREREVLQIPDQIWNPFVKISDFLGLIHRGNAFSLIICNAVYQDQIQPKQNPDNSSDPCHLPLWRFRFNSNERVLNTEEIFYHSFLQMETAFKKGLCIIADYLTQTELAMSSSDKVIQSITFERRIKLLTELKSNMKAISKIYYDYVTESKIVPGLWSKYVQSMIGWNINGIKSGASGAESILFHILDEFLHIPGDCALYRSAVDKRSGIPHYYRCLIDSLKCDREFRFNKLNTAHEGSNPIMKCRDDIVQCLGMWRLSHAKTSRKYLEQSHMTASGTVDKIYDEDEESLPDRAEAELRQRARETLRCINDRNRRRKSLEICHPDTKRLQYLVAQMQNEKKSYFQTAFEYFKCIFSHKS